MPWFKVDDSFHSHPKVWAASPASLGLWVVAGAWSSANLNDGFVPDHAIPRLLPDAAELAKELVTAGLWTRTKGGYRFHDWHDYNPTAEEVNADRLSARKRMKDLRAKRKANHEGAGQGGNCSPEHSANFGRSSEEVPNPDPTRPEPSKEVSFGARADRESSAPKEPGKNETRIPENFGPDAGMVAWAASNAPDVDGRHETAQFVDWWRSKGAVRADWVATWRTWMRNAQQRAGTAGHMAATPGPAPPGRVPESEKCAHRRRASTCGLCRSERIGVLE